MSRLRAFIVACFIYASGQHAFGQRTEYSIDPATFDVAYFKHVVLKDLNELRHGRKVEPLAYDRILALAADDQALFLLKTHGSGPFQNGDVRKRAPEKRVSFYGGSFTQISELEHRTVVQEHVSANPKIPEFYYVNSTYEQLSRNILEHWQSNPHDSKTILSDRFRFFGAEIKIDTGSYEVVIVAVFGGEGGKAQQLTVDPPDQRYELKMPPKPASYAFGFREPLDDYSQRKVRRWYKTLRTDDEHEISSSYRLARKVFRWWHRRTGIVLETGSVDPATEQSFHSLPSRLDQTSLYQQTPVVFVSARKLMRTSRKISWTTHEKIHLKILGIKTPFVRRPERFLLSVGDFGSYDRLVVVRKKRAAAIIDVHPLPCALFDPLPVRIPYQSLSGDFLDKEKMIFVKDTVEQRFYYARNEVQPEPSDLTDIASRIPADRLVREIRLEAHASIEGNLASNQQLFTQRGDVIRSFLTAKGLVASDIKTTIQASENWSIFNEQIKGSAYEDLKGKSQTEIRTFINQHKNDSTIKAWLDEQRYSNVFLVLNRPVKVEVNEDSLGREFNRLATHPPKIWNDKAMWNIYRIQWSFYDRIAKAKQLQRWSELIIPADPRWSSMRFNELMYRWDSGLLSEVDLFKNIQLLGLERTVQVPLYSRLLFNNNAFILNHYFVDQDLDQTVPISTFHVPAERNLLLYFKSTNRRGVAKQDHRPLDIIMLDYLPQSISDLNRFGEKSDLPTKLREFYLIKSINSYEAWNRIKYRSVIRNFIKDLWNNHVTRANLTDDDRIRWALYFNYFHDFSKSAWLLSPLVNRPDPHHEALRLWIFILSVQQPYDVVRNAILKARKNLTHEEWIDLVTSGKYLTRDIINDYRIRKTLQNLSSGK